MNLLSVKYWLIEHPCNRSLKAKMMRVWTEIMARSVKIYCFLTTYNSDYGTTKENPEIAKWFDKYDKD